MKACYMFGHRDAPTNIMPKLEVAIEQLYSLYNVNRFYVGTEGSFSHSAYIAAVHVKERHPDIKLYLLSDSTDTYGFMSKGADGYFTPPVDNIPPQYAFYRANRYMVDNCDYLICYALYSGNSTNLLDYAQRCARKRKIYILNLA